MKQTVTILSVVAFLVLMISVVFSQDYVAPGYSKIFERNEFETAPHWPIVADEVHAGFDLDKDSNLEFFVLADHSDPNGPSGAGWSDGHSIYLYEWNPTANEFNLMWSWSDTSLSNGAASFPTAAVGDLDGDGDQEIIFGIPHGAGFPLPDVSPTVIYIFEFGSAGLPTEPTAIWNAEAKPGTNTRPAAMATGDIDKDGEMEVAVAFRNFSSAATNDALMIFSLLGDYAGVFTQFKIEMIDTTSDLGSVYSADITDLDNDGNLEAYFSTDFHTAYEATGTDAYEFRKWDSKIYPWTIQATVEADVDGDGKNELLFGKYATGHLGIVYGVTDWATADSTNEAEIALVDAGGCRGMTAGDYDGDGNLDVFWGGNYSGKVTRVEYKGSGDIADSTSYNYEIVYLDTIPKGDTRVYSVSFPGDNFGKKMGGTTSTDMNKNGKPELLIAYEDGDSLQMWIVMIEGNGVTGIELRPGEQVLKTYVLSQNYPNPFNPTTSISYTIPENGLVTLKVYNLLGEEVKTLVDKNLVSGSYSATWDGTNNAGNKISSGQYIYRLKAGGQVLSRTMTLVK